MKAHFARVCRRARGWAGWAVCHARSSHKYESTYAGQKRTALMANHVLWRDTVEDCTDINWKKFQTFSEACHWHRFWKSTVIINTCGTRSKQAESPRCTASRWINLFQSLILRASEGFRVSEGSWMKSLNVSWRKVFCLPSDIEIGGTVNGAWESTGGWVVRKWYREWFICWTDEGNQLQIALCRPIPLHLHNNSRSCLLGTHHQRSKLSFCLLNCK